MSPGHFSASPCACSWGVSLSNGEPPLSPKAAQVKDKHVDPRCRQLPGQVVPYLPLPVALVQQQNSGAGLDCCEVGCLEGGTVGRLQVKHPCRRQLLRRGTEGQQGCNEQQQTKAIANHGSPRAYFPLPVALVQQQNSGAGLLLLHQCN